MRRLLAWLRDERDLYRSLSADYQRHLTHEAELEALIAERRDQGELRHPDDTAHNGW